MTNNRPRTSLLVWLLIAGIVSPVVYFLSIGPVAWLRFHSGLSPVVLELIELPFWPLAWLRDNFEPMGDVLDWYVELWQ